MVTVATCTPSSRERGGLHLDQRPQAAFCTPRVAIEAIGPVRRPAAGDQHRPAPPLAHPGQHRADRRLQADGAGGEVGQQVLGRRGPARLTWRPTETL